MKNLFVSLIIIALIHSSCKKTEIVELNLKGAIKGKVTSLDEFSANISKTGNINIMIEGTYPLISGKTDSSGNFLITNIPTGTYNITISKEGYTTYQEQGVQVLGGDKPIYKEYYISEISKTTIEDLKIAYVGGPTYAITAKVYHNCLFNDIWAAPYIRFFFSNNESISYSQYSYTFIDQIHTNSGEEIISYFSIFDKKKYKSGSVLYVIAYGTTLQGTYYDIVSDKTIYSSLGKASNIATITIP